MAFDWGNVKTANLADATRRYPVDNAADFDKPHVRVESLEWGPCKLMPGQLSWKSAKQMRLFCNARQRRTAEAIHWAQKYKIKFTKRIMISFWNGQLKFEF